MQRWPRLLRSAAYTVFGITLCAGASAVFAAAATPNQNYPVRPIRIIIGNTAGGSSDVTARMIGQKVTEAYGQPVIIDTRPGAGGSLAIEKTVAAPADGYTLLVISSAGVIQAAMGRDLSYDLRRDLAPISLVTNTPNVLVVNPTLPARNVKELIALAQSQPGKLSYGSAGVGSAAHFAGVLFNLLAKVNIVHVPYKGGAESAVATATGEVNLSFPGIPGALPLLQSGRLRALGVTSLQRASFLPDVPSLSEAGLPGYDYAVWQGLLAPAKTPKSIVDRLSAIVAKAVESQEMKQSFRTQGLEPMVNSPAQFAALLRSETDKYTKLVQSAGLKPE